MAMAGREYFLSYFPLIKSVEERKIRLHIKSQKQRDFPSRFGTCRSMAPSLTSIKLSDDRESLMWLFKNF